MRTRGATERDRAGGGTMPKLLKLKTSDKVSELEYASSLKGSENKIKNKELKVIMSRLKVPARPPIKCNPIVKRAIALLSNHVSHSEKQSSGLGLDKRIALIGLELMLVADLIPEAFFHLDDDASESEIKIATEEIIQDLISPCNNEFGQVPSTSDFDVELLTRDKPDNVTSMFILKCCMEAVRNEIKSHGAITSTNLQLAQRAFKMLIGRDPAKDREEEGMSHFVGRVADICQSYGFHDVCVSSGDFPALKKMKGCQRSDDPHDAPSTSYNAFIPCEISDKELLDLRLKHIDDAASAVDMTNSEEHKELIPMRPCTPLPISQNRMFMPVREGETEPHVERVERILRTIIESVFEHLTDNPYSSVGNHPVDCTGCRAYTEAAGELLGGDDASELIKPYIAFNAAFNDFARRSSVNRLFFNAQLHSRILQEQEGEDIQ